MTKISFPGLGIDPFEINNVAFTVFGIDIYWYGIIITFGMICAVAYAIWRAKQIGIGFDQMTDMAIFTILFGVVGARAYYVLTSLDQYDSILDVLSTRNGGLAIYGGIIAGTLTIYVFCRIKKINAAKMFDCIAPGVMLAQSIGRWGNFFNAEAYGAVTDLPWRMCSPSIASDLIRDGFVDMKGYAQVISGELGVHPTFLYESLWNILGFVLINIFYKRKKFDFQIALSYFAWYGLGRMFIEGLRTDSLYVGVFRISQVVGFLCFVIGGIALIYFLRKAIRKEKDAVAYDRSYEKLATEKSSSFDTSFIEENESSESETQADTDINTDEESNGDENGEDN